MVALAFGSASTVTVAQARGRNNGLEVRQEAFTALALVVGFEILTALVIIVFKGLLPDIYIDDPNVIALAGTLLLYAAAFQVFDGVQAVGLGILRGLDDTKIPTIIAFFSYTLIALPLSYILSTQTSLQEQGVWLGYVIALAVASISYGIRIHIQTKKGQV
jgi:MATE family multidrug resistance protein